MNLRKIGSYIVLLCIFFSCEKQDDPVYRNTAYSVEERVSDLLRRMTLEEKVAQISAIYRNEKRIVHDQDGIFDLEKAKKNLQFGIGHISRPSEIGGIQKVAKFTNDVQKFLMENTRLGIPALFHEEGLHGHMADSSTVFPSATALASTWDPELVEEVYSVVAREIRARGGNVALTPVVDVARDPRWGRFEETYGEDPYLVYLMGKAAVHGFQGHDLPVKRDRVAATLKHFVAHGHPEGGINVAPPQTDEQTLHEVHLYPFRKIIKETKVLSIMASYNEVNGSPLHSNGHLLTDLLRKQWGFRGTVVSDYGGVKNLIDRHYVAKDSHESAIMALKAGVDIELPEEFAFNQIDYLVKEGFIEESILDSAVTRVLRQKFLLGLFEDPYTSLDDIYKNISVPDHFELAEEVALESVTLLENNGILPLDPQKIQKIAVIGPNADYGVLGGYSGKPVRNVTPFQGILKYLEGKADVYHHVGCRITENEPNWRRDEVIPADPEKNRQRIEEALSIVERSDIVILCLGDNESVSREAWSERHLGDRPDLRLLGDQELLFHEIKKTGKPVVTLLFTNGPRQIEFLSKKSDAILQCWYLGQESGNALAKILFGNHSPSGKLIASFPRSVGHIPVFYNHKPTARRGYLSENVSPLYPFGYGLSYTEFKYSNIYLSSDTILKAGEKIKLTVDVTNTGSVIGKEVVMLFIRDKLSSLTRPVKELKDFKKLSLKPGETKTVGFVISEEMLSFWHPGNEYYAEPGDFTIIVGNEGPEAEITLM